MCSKNTAKPFHYTCLTAQKMKFSIMNFFSKCDQIRSFTADFITVTEEILGKLNFLCSVYCRQVLWQVDIICIQQEDGDFIWIGNSLMMERRQTKKTQHCKANNTPLYSNCVWFIYYLVWKFFSCILHR